MYLGWTWSVSFQPQVIGMCCWVELIDIRWDVRGGKVLKKDHFHMKPEGGDYEFIDQFWKREPRDPSLSLGHKLMEKLHTSNSFRR